MYVRAMASLAPKLRLSRFIYQPMRGGILLLCGLFVWLAGAAYCMGYEQLRSGLGHWPGSLTWSAVAVMPWFALFEWAKRCPGKSTTLTEMGVLMTAVALASLALEWLSEWIQGNSAAPLALLLLRRLPAIGTFAMLVALARRSALASLAPEPSIPPDASLDMIAHLVDWVAAADNYVELRIGGHTVIRRMTMLQAERALAPHGFVRVHRRYLVNGSRMTDVRSNGRRAVRLSDGTQIPVGRSYEANLSNS